jgi:superfamily II DNA or RNA helicase
MISKFGVVSIPSGIKLGPQYLTWEVRRGAEIKTERANRWKVLSLPSGANIRCAPRHLAREAGVKFPPPRAGLELPELPVPDLRDFQMEIRATVVETIRATGGATLKLGAGRGKTYIAAGVAHALGQHTLYVVVNHLLMNQAVRELESIFGPVVGSYSGTSKTIAPITVITVNSLMSPSFQVNGKSVSHETFIRRFGFSVYDECHMHVTDKRLQNLDRSMTRYTMGMSAEADKNERCMLMRMRLGPIIRGDDESIGGAMFSSQIYIVKYKGPPEFTRRLINEQTEMMQSSYMAAQFTCDPWRMQLVLDEVKSMYDRGRDTFVFVDTRIAATILHELLEKVGVVPADMITLIGGAGEDAIAAASNRRVVVATYQYVSVGVSIPKFNSMVFACPRRNGIYQTLKRIYRLTGDPAIRREVVDIVDASTPVASQLADRRQVYDMPVFGANITVREVNWRSITPTHTRLHMQVCIQHLQADHNTNQTKRVYGEIAKSCKKLIR